MADSAKKEDYPASRPLFIQEIVNEIRKFNISVRKEENEARKADNLVPLPEEESYPTGYFKSLHLFWKMIKVIRGAAKQEPSKKREFSEQRKEAGKVFKIIIAEWVLANLGFAAIFGYWVLPEIIAVLPIFGVLGSIPFIIFGILTFWAIAYFNYSSLFVIIRDEKKMDSIRNWRSAKDVFEQLKGSDSVQEGDASKEFHRIFGIFYRHFVESLYSATDQPGRGPLITKDQYARLIVRNADGQIDISLIDDLDCSVKDMFRDFLDKWLQSYYYILANPSRLEEIKTGLQEKRANLQNGRIAFRLSELTWQPFDKFDEEGVNDKRENKVNI